MEGGVGDRGEGRGSAGTRSLPWSVRPTYERRSAGTTVGAPLASDKNKRCHWTDRSIARRVRGAQPVGRRAGVLCVDAEGRDRRVVVVVVNRGRPEA
jgi:hypothetical protein